MGTIRVPSPGSRCQVGSGGDSFSATVQAVSVHACDRVLVLVAWWDRRTRYEEWLELHEIGTAETGETTIGFS